MVRLLYKFIAYNTEKDLEFIINSRSFVLPHNTIVIIGQNHIPHSIQV